MSAESEPATGDLLLLLHAVEDVRDHFVGELFVGRLLVVGILCPTFIVFFLLQTFIRVRFSKNVDENVNYIAFVVQKD